MWVEYPRAAVVVWPWQRGAAAARVDFAQDGVVAVLCALVVFDSAVGGNVDGGEPRLEMERGGNFLKLHCNLWWELGRLLHSIMRIERDACYFL